MIKKVSLLLLVTIGVIGSAWFLLFQSIRLDEAQTIWVSTKPVDNLLRLVGGDVHVPLYFLLMHFWIQFFGTEIAIVRLPSIIFFLLSLIGLYKLGQEEGNPTAGLLAVALFSLSPFMLWYSFEARMYTLFVLLAILSHLYYLRLLRSKGEKSKFGFLIITLLGIYTHYFFLSILFCQTIYLFFLSIIESPRKDGIMASFRLNFQTIKAFCILAFIAIIFLLPWIFYVFRLGQIAESTPLIQPPDAFNFFQTFAFFLFGYQSSVTQGLVVSLWPMVVLFLFLVFTHRRKIKFVHFGYLEIVTFLPILFFFCLSFFVPVFLARYLIFTIPTLFLLLANTLLVFSGVLAKILVALFFLLSGSFLIYQNFSPATPVKENYQGVTELLNSEVTPVDIVAVTSPFTVYPIEYYYRGNARVDTIPQWNRFSEGGIPEFSEVKLEEQLKNYQLVYSRAFVIFSYDQGYEDIVRNYLDTHFEMLGKKEFSEGLELRVYKLRYAF